MKKSIKDMWTNDNYQKGKDLLGKIRHQQQVAKQSDAYQTILTDYALNGFATAYKRLMDEGNLFYLSYYYNLFTSIDETGYLPKDAGEYLEQFMKNGYQLRMYKVDSDEELEEVLSTGVPTDRYQQLSPLNRLFTGVDMAIQLKADWASEQTAVLFALPNDKIRGNSVNRRDIEEFYDVNSNGLVISPGFILGVAHAKNGHCTFYDKSKYKQGAIPHK